jgi:glycerol-3-phosphate dehydrogenase
MPDTSRLLVECLSWAVSGGARALNYAELLEPRPEPSARTRLVLKDLESGATLSVVAGAIINAGGAQIEEVARRLGARSAALLVPTLAWNLLLDAGLPGASSIVLTPQRRGGQTYFLQPFHGRTLAGTGHAAMPGTAEQALPARASIDSMRRDLDAAWPGAGLGAAPVLRVLAGILPGIRPGTSRLASRPRVVCELTGSGSPIVHVVGVKFTEAPVVAVKALDHIGVSFERNSVKRPPAGVGWHLAGARDAATTRTLLDLAASESVVYLEDLIERRTNAWCDESATALVERLLEGKLARRKSRGPPMHGSETGEGVSQ